MSAANLAVIAASLLTTASVFSDVSDADAGVTLLPTRDAVVQDVWPVASGTLSMPHLLKPLVLQNGFRGSAPENAPLYLCITTDVLNEDQLYSWVNALNTTSPVQLYLVVGADATHPKLLPFVRRLTSTLKSSLAAYIEVVLDESHFPGFLNKNDERMMVQRDVCMRLMGRIKPEDDAFLLAVDLAHSPLVFPATHVEQHQSGGYSITVGSDFTVTHNVVSGQDIHFAVPNTVRFQPKQTRGTQVVFDLSASWQLERLRVGPAVVGGYLHNIAGHLMWMWSRSKQDLFQMTSTANKTYALASRALASAIKIEDDLHAIIRTLPFRADQRDERTHYPLALGRCASYRLNVLEPAVTSTTTDADGQHQKRKGTIGRIEMNMHTDMGACLTASSSGQPLQLCQPQANPSYHMRNAYGEEPKGRPYRNVVPLLAPKGVCIAGGRVPLLHRKSYGSYSDYGVYPRGFDAYDMFSLMEGVIDGDSQAARLLAPSLHNPKDLPDQDKVRVMPTLVPVRLKKAK